MLNVAPPVVVSSLSEGAAVCSEVSLRKDFRAEHAERAEERHAENGPRGKIWVRSKAPLKAELRFFGLRGEVRAPECVHRRAGARRKEGWMPTPKRSFDAVLPLVLHVSPG